MIRKALDEVISLLMVFSHIRLRVFANAEIQCEENVSAYFCVLLQATTFGYRVKDETRNVARNEVESGFKVAHQ